MKLLIVLIGIAHRRIYIQRFWFSVEKRGKKNTRKRIFFLKGSRVLWPQGYISNLEYLWGSVLKSVSLKINLYLDKTLKYKSM